MVVLGIRVLLVICVAALTACGGGSGGGSGGESSGGGGSAGSFTVSQTQFNFSAAQYGNIPASQSMSVSWSNPNIAGFAFVFPEGEQPPTWISFSSTTDTSSPASVDIEITNTDLEPGTYTTTLPFYAGDIDYNELGNINIQVTYTVTEQGTGEPQSDGTPGIDLSQSSFEFNITTPEVRVTDSIDLSMAMSDDSAENWSASADRDWVVLSATAGTMPATINVAVDALALPPRNGNFVSYITVNAGDYEKQIYVIAKINVPELVLSPSTMNFEVLGENSSDPQQLNIDMTDSNTVLTWAATSNQDWLLISETEGTTPSTPSVSIDPTQLPAEEGRYTGLIEVSGQGYRESIEVVVDNNLAALTLSSTGLAFEVVSENEISAGQIEISLSDGSANSWSASSDSPWLVLGASSGTTPSTLRFSIQPTAASLDNGIYTGTIDIQSGELQGRVTVTLTLNLPVLEISDSSLLFSGINGANLATDQLEIRMSDGGANPWTASSDQDWLLISERNGTTPATLNVSVDPANSALASGNYQGTILVSVGDDQQSVPVSLSLTQATLTVPESMLFGGEDGLDESLSAPLTFSTDTGSTAHTWSLSLSKDWLSSATTTGQVDGAGTSQTLTIDPAELPGGTYSANANLSVAINGDLLTAQVPVTLNKETRKLFIADNGIALVNLPSYQNLSHRLEVKDTLGKTTDWSAQSDQSWLTVTASGTTNDDLVLTADVSGLTPDQLYLAQVSVSSSDPQIENTETLRVGLWYGSTDPNFSDSIEDSNFAQIEADPIRPYVYTHNQGGDINVYHVYTAERLATLALGDIYSGDMTISSDGSTLYVFNRDDGSVILVNLNSSNPDSLSVQTVATQLSGYPILEYARFSAQDYVLASTGDIYSADFSTSDPIAMAEGMPAANRDGTRLCYLDDGASPHSIYCAPIQYSALGDGGLQTTADVLSYRGQGTARDIALNSTGNRIFVASTGGGYVFYDYSYDGSEITTVSSLPARAFPSNVAISNNDVLYGAARWTSEGIDYWVYDWTTGNELESADLSGSGASITDRQLVLSGDSQRAIALVGNSTLVIRQAGFSL